MAQIVPAILTSDLSDFRRQYAELFALSHHFRRLHVDFADEFVGNQTLMPADLQFLRASPFALDAHFMTKKPRQYFEDAKKAGFVNVLFHFEAMQDDGEIADTIAAAEKLGLRAGIVINPETKVYRIAKYVKSLKLVQIMGIPPGAQGREFIPATLEKIKELKKLTKDVIILADGGIKVGIARAVAQAGADWIVVGSAIRDAQNKKAVLEAFLEDIKI